VTDAPKSIVDDARTAAAWIAEALASSGYKADFSIASLKEVDRFFREHAKKGKAKARGLLAQDLGAKLFALGAYVGEVIRREAGGEWHGDDSDPRAEINIELHLPGGATIWPVQRVMNLFRNGPEDSVWVYGIVLSEPKAGTH